MRALLLLPLAWMVSTLALAEERPPVTVEELMRLAELCRCRVAPAPARLTEREREAVNREAAELHRARVVATRALRDANQAAQRAHARWFESSDELRGAAERELAYAIAERDRALAERRRLDEALRALLGRVPSDARRLPTAVEGHPPVADWRRPSQEVDPWSCCPVGPHSGHAPSPGR